MQKRNILNSPRLLELKKKRLKVFRNKILLSLSAFLAIFAGLAYLSRIPSLNISGVEITGNKAVDAEMMKVTVEKVISGDYLWFFPKKNILLYPENNIKKELHNQFERIRDITLSIKGKSNLEISITEREPKYTWCGVSPAESLGAPVCYFMDESGYIFDKAPYFSGEVYFKFYGLFDINNIDNPLGSYFSKQNFEQLVSFKYLLAGIGLKPVALYIADNGDAQMFLSDGDSLMADPKIIFKVDSDFQKVAENLETALSTEPLQSNFKNKYSSLLYIDLRFGSKVYYKFK